MKDLEKKAKKFLKERGWNHLRPSDIAKSISIEAGELLEVFQWSSLAPEEVLADKEKLEAVKKELADVFLFSIYMAVTLGLDCEKVILDKLEHAKKKYPPHVVKNDGKREPGTEDFYHHIKKTYRRSGLS